MSISYRNFSSRCSTCDRWNWRLLAWKGIIKGNIQYQHRIETPALEFAFPNLHFGDLSFDLWVAKFFSPFFLSFFFFFFLNSNCQSWQILIWPCRMCLLTQNHVPRDLDTWIYIANYFLVTERQRCIRANRAWAQVSPKSFTFDPYVKWRVWTRKIQLVVFW